MHIFNASQHNQKNQEENKARDAVGDESSTLPRVPKAWDALQAKAAGRHTRQACLICGAPAQATHTLSKAAPPRKCLTLTHTHTHLQDDAHPPQRPDQPAAPKQRPLDATAARQRLLLLFDREVG